jgi:hypothetical protein
MVRLWAWINVTDYIIWWQEYALRIFAYFLEKNYKMLQLCNKKGFKMETLDEETVKASLILF